MPVSPSNTNNNNSQLSVGEQQLELLKKQKQAFAAQNNKEREAELNTAIICLEMILNKEKISLYNAERLKKWSEARKAATDRYNSPSNILMATEVIYGMVTYSEQVASFYQAADKNMQYLAIEENQKKSKLNADFYNQRPFAIHTSNGLLALLPILSNLRDFIELQNARGKEREYSNLADYINRCEQAVLNEIKARLEDAIARPSLHPFINFMEDAIKTKKLKVLPQNKKYYPEIIATEESSPAIKGELIHTLVNHPRAAKQLQTINPDAMAQQLDITKLVKGAKVDNQQLSLPENNDKNYSYKLQRFKLQCEIVPKLAKFNELNTQLTELEAKIKQETDPHKLRFLKAKAVAVYQEADLTLNIIHALIEKTRKSSLFGSLALGRKTTKYLADIENVCINLEKQLATKIGKPNEDNDKQDYLQGQRVKTRVKRVKGDTLVVRDEIQHYAGGMSKGLNQYLLETTKKANWQRFNDNFFAVREILNYPKSTDEQDIDLISGTTRLADDVINFSPFDPLNVQHELTNNDVHYIGDLSLLNNDKITSLLQYTKQMREALESQKQILRSNFESFSPIARWWYYSVYVKEKAAIDKKLSLVVKPLENKLNGEVFRRLKTNLRYGQLDESTQATWEQSLNKSHGFICYNLSTQPIDQVKVVLEALKAEEQELKKAISHVFITAKVKAAKQKLARLKDMQRNLIYQQEKGIAPIQLTIDNEYARSFVANLVKQNKLGTLNSTWLENLVQRKEVLMYEIQPRELKTIMNTLLAIHKKDALIFGQFYEALRGSLENTRFSAFSFEGAEFNTSTLVEKLFAQQYDFEVRAAFAIWLARHRENLFTLKDEKVSTEVKTFCEELLKIIPKQVVSYSKATQGLLEVYNNEDEKKEFGYINNQQLPRVESIEQWMQAVRISAQTNDGHFAKTETFLTWLKEQQRLPKNVNDEMLNFKINYLEQMVKHVKNDKDLLNQPFIEATNPSMEGPTNPSMEEPTNPLKSKYQEEVNSTLNVIRDIIYNQKGRNDFYFNWLGAAVRSELTRVKALINNPGAFIPAGLEASLQNYIQALEIIRDILQGKKAQITEAERTTLEILADNSKQAKTHNVTSVYEGIADICAKRLNSMITKAYYNRSYRTQLANFASLEAEYKQAKQDTHDQDSAHIECISIAKNAIEALILDNKYIQPKNFEDAQGLLKATGRFEKIESMENLWQSVLLVQLSAQARKATIDKMREYVDSYEGQNLNLSTLFITFCRPDANNIWQSDCQKLMEDYADNYFSRIFDKHNLILGKAIGAEDRLKLKYLLNLNIPGVNEKFNKKAAEWIKETAEQGRKWLKVNQNVLRDLSASLDNCISYANIGLKELLAHIPASNASHEETYQEKLQEFLISTLGKEEKQRWYPAYNDLTPDQKTALDTIMKRYLKGNHEEFKKSQLPIGNVHDDKIVARLIGHDAPYLSQLRQKSLERWIKSALNQNNALQFSEQSEDVVHDFERRLAIFKENEPSTILPLPKTPEYTLHFTEMLNNALKNKPWRKEVDQLLAGKMPQLDTRNISLFVEKGPLSNYRLQHLEMLLKLPQLNISDLSPFYEYVEGKAFFTPTDYAKLQLQLVEAVNKGWTPVLDKLISKYGDKVTQEICLAQAFAKALQDGKTDIVAKELGKNGKDLFTQEQGQRAIIAVMETYRKVCKENANLATKKTAYSKVAQDILKIIDVDYAVYKNAQLSITPTQLSLEHAAAGLVQFALNNSKKTREEANEALNEYLESLPTAIKEKLEAETKTWFDEKSLDEVLLSLREQLIEQHNVWNSNLFALVEKYATPEVYDKYILSHAKQFLRLKNPTKAEAYSQLIPSENQPAIAENFVKFKTETGFASFAALLDAQLVEWYDEDEPNLVVANKHLKDLIGLHLNQKGIQPSVVDQAIDKLLAVLSLKDSKFLKKLNELKTQWQEDDSQEIDYAVHREFLAKRFEKLFRTANGEAVNEFTIKVLKQYRLLSILESGKEEYLNLARGLELEDLVQIITKQPMNVQNFVNWYVPTDSSSNEYGLHLAKNARKINYEMLNLLNTWTQELCKEDDVRYQLVSNILSEVYLKFLSQHEKDLAEELKTKFNEVKTRLQKAKVERSLCKDLQFTLQNGNINQLETLCKTRWQAKFADEKTSPSEKDRLLDILAGLLRISMPECESIAVEPIYNVLQGEVASTATDILEQNKKLETIAIMLKQSNEKLTKLIVPYSDDNIRLQNIRKTILELIAADISISERKKEIEENRQSNHNLVDSHLADYNQSTVNVQKLQQDETLFNKKYLVLVNECAKFGIDKQLDLSQRLEIINGKLQEKQKFLDLYLPLQQKLGLLFMLVNHARIAVPAFNKWNVQPIVDEKQNHDVLKLDSNQVICLAMALDQKRFEDFTAKLADLAANTTQVSIFKREHYLKMLALVKAARSNQLNEEVKSVYSKSYAKLCKLENVYEELLTRIKQFPKHMEETVYEGDWAKGLFTRIALMTEFIEKRLQNEPVSKEANGKEANLNREELREVNYLTQEQAKTLRGKLQEFVATVTSKKMKLSPQVNIDTVQQEQVRRIESYPKMYIALNNSDTITKPASPIKTGNSASGNTQSKTSTSKKWTETLGGAIGSAVNSVNSVFGKRKNVTSSSPKTEDPTDSDVSSLRSTSSTEKHVSIVSIDKYDDSITQLNDKPHIFENYQQDDDTDNDLESSTSTTSLTK